MHGRSSSSTRKTTVTTTPRRSPEAASAAAGASTTCSSIASTVAVLVGGRTSSSFMRPPPGPEVQSQSQSRSQSRHPQLQRKRRRHRRQQQPPRPPRLLTMVRLLPPVLYLVASVSLSMLASLGGHVGVGGNAFASAPSGGVVGGFRGRGMGKAATRPSSFRSAARSSLAAAAFVSPSPRRGHGGGGGGNVGRRSGSLVSSPPPPRKLSMRGWIPPSSSSSALRSDVSGGYVSPTDIGGDDDDDDDDRDPSRGSSSPGGSSLAVPSDTRLLLGLNKYSHDASLCAADANTGTVLFYLAKERLSRRKHDGGSTASLVRKCLECLDLTLGNVDGVVVNNHHHRVLPLEEDVRGVEWRASLGIDDVDGGDGGDDDGMDSEYNLLPGAEKREMSHHLAHAYSAAAQAPFSSGLVVVMDGMGETYRTMRHAMLTGDGSYVSDLNLVEAGGGDRLCVQVPSDIERRSERSIFDWREGESAYVFRKTEDSIRVEPVFKRWIEERTPPTLYNHGFHDMESVGAVYSRASSHIFGNWNVCGKVMGLAPWRDRYGDDEKEDATKNRRTTTMSGRLYEEAGRGGERRPFTVEEGAMVGRAYASDGSLSFEFDEETEPIGDVTRKAIELAASVQDDLEEVGLDFVTWLREWTGESNLCLAGGVALNSVLNGRICREVGFDEVFIPPYPGDDGIAVGCCAYGLFGNDAEGGSSEGEGTGKQARPPIWTKPLTPYLGPDYDDLDVDDALADASPWLVVEQVADEKLRLEIVAREIASGGVVAWYHGRSEAGPRALGHRSILSDPRKEGMAKFINNKVKGRESFRPFAPSVLAEEAGDWFEGLGEGSSANASPYMSITTNVRPEKRKDIPAVTHVDGTSRLQTVEEEAEPFYHRLISTFFKQTGVPMVLNTSFNTLKGEPIVESPAEAVRSFLCSMGAIEMLVIGDNIVRRQKASLPALLGEKKKSGLVEAPKLPVAAGPFMFESTCKYTNEASQEDPVMSIKVRMLDRPMHDDSKDGGWFQLTDELEADILTLCDGSVSVQKMVQEYQPEDAEGLDQTLFQNLINRLTRLFEHTLISW